MDDPSIPFEFEDCDAFLASLDDNNNNSSSKHFHQDFTDMNDFTTSSMDSWNLESFSMPSSNSSSTTTSNNNNHKYMISPAELDSSNYTVQSSNFYSNPESSTSSPLSSPSMSIHSISDSDTTGGFLNGSLFSGPNTTSAGLDDHTQYSTASTLSTAVAGLESLSYPITPPYPSEATSSAPSSTSPEDHAFNESYQAFSSPNPNFAAVKSEPMSPPLPAQRSQQGIKVDPVSPRAAKQATKSGQSKKPTQKLNNDSKGNKVTKPKKEKTSHNMIEKRYRTNINDKILALRDCVPSLRCVVSGTSRQSEDLEGLTPASKLNKATVLTKATEYILHLQKRNELLLKQLQEARSSSGMGMMPEMGGQRQGNMQYQQREQGSNFASKAMMLSMAGIMGAGLMNEGSSDMRGLSALPVFSFISTTAIGPLNSTSVLFALKIALILGTVVYLIAPSLFDDNSSNKKVQQFDETVDDHEYSLREMRRQLWLTNSRAFTIPAERLSAQLLAFVGNFVSVLTITLLGSDGYEMVARALDREPLAAKRVALSRAIDAQLCGGDQENLSRGRLFYTFVKSFILPATPSRYLTQAVHVSLLGQGIRFLDTATFYLAKYFWSLAKAAVANEPESENEDATPKHIRALLTSSTGDCLETYKRVYNVAYGLPVSDGCATGEDDEGYLSVVTDKSIRSVCDVVAALYTNILVHRVLINVLESDEIDFKLLELCSAIDPPCSIVGRRVAITEALLLGPKDASYAKNAMDMLKEELDQQAWLARENTVPVQEDSDVSTSASESECDSVSTARGIRDVAFLTSSVKTSSAAFAVSQDSRLGIRCSLILCYMSRSKTPHAFSLLQNVEINKLEPISLLGFVSLWKVLRELHDRKYAAAASASIRPRLEDLAAVARVWLGGAAARKEGVELSKLRELVGESVEMSKFFGGFGEGEMDEGYGSTV